MFETNLSTMKITKCGGGKVESKEWAPHDLKQKT